MPLTLTIRNVDSLENGSPRSLVLDGRGAQIGRGANTDWRLPDPTLHISSRHCEIVFRDGRYALVDKSTNGTFLGDGEAARIEGSHVLHDGDVFAVGKYEIVASLSEDSPTPVPSGDPQAHESAADRPSSSTTPEPSGAAEAMLLSSTPAPSTSESRASAPVPPHRPSTAAAKEPSGADQSGGIWDQFEASNAVDWARGGFGAAEAGSEPASGEAAPPPTSGIALLLATAGLSPAELKHAESEALSQAGMLLRRMIAGLVVMMEARARAKSQMGAAGTGLELAGNNPLKFARTPEQAIAMMLNPPERGFMPADRAIEDSFRDLQAHQMATLKAMQGALRTTLDRFSPKAIRSRASVTGFLAKIFPALAEAQLWRAYEREFSGVALGSDEAFMDLFAKEFRRAYEDQARLS